MKKKFNFCLFTAVCLGFLQINVFAMEGDNNEASKHTPKTQSNSLEKDEDNFLKHKTVLTIAGSDPSGGAGIQADLKTVSALGCYGMSVLTTLTAQNTTGVQAIHSLPKEFVGAQLKSIFDDINVDVVKVGLLGNTDIIEEVAGFLQKNKHSERKIVVDPVMFAKNGDPLSQNDTIDVLKKKIIPLATIITPNIHEASFLLGGNIISTKEDMEKAAYSLLDLGSEAVIVKGGALQALDCHGHDCLVIKGDPQSHWFNHKGFDTPNTHGAGCTFSSAIAAYLAKGYDTLNAVESAKKYISGAIENGAEYKVGNGKGPVHHFYDSWAHLTTTQELPFSKLAWDASQPILQKIYQLPFIQELSSGTLEREKFTFYLRQDWQYLNDFAKALAQTALLASDDQDSKALIKFAHDASIAEQALHLSFFREYNVSKETLLSPACFNYVNHFRAVVAKGNYPNALASLLPCFWVYEDVGKCISKSSGEMNPYAAWIAAYSSKKFEESVNLMIKITNQSLVGKAQAEIDEAIKIFKISTNFELKFWDDAYNLSIYEF